MFCLHHYRPSPTRLSTVDDINDYIYPKAEKSRFSKCEKSCKFVKHFVSETPHSRTEDDFVCFF